MTDSLPYLFILKNGPVYSLDKIAYQLETLSERFRGELWVTGAFDRSVTIGRFTANVVQEEYNPRTPILSWRYLKPTWRYFRTLLKQARETDRRVPGVKVIVTYDPFKNGLIGHLLSRALGWPLIVEVNGDYGDPNNYADSKGVHARHIKSAVARFVGRRVISRAQGVRLLFDEQLTNFASPGPDCIVRRFFSAPLPLERFRPGPEEPIILHVGYPYRRKGVDLLLEAFSQVSSDFPEWKLVLIGHALQLNIPNPPPNVIVMKPIRNTEVASWLSRCAVFVLASRSEAMGRVLIEAAAAGKPRIAARVGGTYTVVSHEEDGLLVEPNDVPALAAALRRIMQDSALRKRLGEAARQRALTEFSGARYVDHLTEMVLAVTAASGGRR